MKQFIAHNFLFTISLKPILSISIIKKKKRSSFISISSLFMQIYFDSNHYPGTYYFLWGNLSKQQFSDIHQPRKDNIILPGNITDFYTIHCFDHNSLFIKSIIRFSEKRQFVFDLQSGLQFFHPLNMCRSGHIGIKQENISFKRLRQRDFPAFSMQCIIRFIQLLLQLLLIFSKFFIQQFLNINNPLSFITLFY